MKLVRYGEPGEEQPGGLDGDGRIRSLVGYVDDIAGSLLEPVGIARLATIDVGSLPLVDDAVRVGPCVGGVGKIVCIGLNFSDHAEESER